jgi:hypothetical protein
VPVPTVCVLCAKQASWVGVHLTGLAHKSFQRDSFKLDLAKDSHFCNPMIRQRLDFR